MNILQSLLSNPITFSILHYSARPHFVELGLESNAYGCNQPLVRRSAWALVQSLAYPCSGELLPVREFGLPTDPIYCFIGEPTLKPCLASICAYILGSAWVEPDPTVRASMWIPLLTFLRGELPTSVCLFPQCHDFGFFEDVPEAWTLAANWNPARAVTDNRMRTISPTIEDDGDSSGSSEDGQVDQSYENHNEHNEPKQDEDTHSNKPQPSVDSWPYREFLQFLQLGCRGSPVQGYPTVVVILATIPPEVRLN